jgi:lipopolysaccharide transport system ATP-binding protein
MKKVIQVENLSKTYDLGLVGTGTLSKDLNRGWAKLRGKPDPYATLAELNDRTKKSETGTVYALKDINFSVEQGEVLGIVGKNGAGKSTLLKILSQITSPSSGSIKIKGRVASLLEVGTGMHPEMTARQNIYLNGSIMGMRRHEITAKLDEIVDFAGIAKYVDTPIKRFSSGMQVRLGFAVAAFLEPEILIVDEVLAVGDAEFQKKAIGKMEDVSKSEGRTVLYVSHNMNSVKSLCKNGLLLSNGNIQIVSNINNVINTYLNTILDIPAEYNWSINDAPGNDYIKLVRTSFINKNHEIIQQVNVNEKFGFSVEYIVLKNYKSFSHSVNVYSSNETHLFSTHDNNCYNANENIAPGKYNSIVWIPADLLQPGEIIFGFACLRYNPLDILFNLNNLGKIQIFESVSSITRPKDYSGEIPGLIRPYFIWERI